MAVPPWKCSHTAPSAPSVVAATTLRPDASRSAALRAPRPVSARLLHTARPQTHPDTRCSLLDPALHRTTRRRGGRPAPRAHVGPAPTKCSSTGRGGEKAQSEAAGRCTRRVLDRRISRVLLLFGDTIRIPGVLLGSSLRGASVRHERCGCSNNEAEGATPTWSRVHACLRSSKPCCSVSFRLFDIISKLLAALRTCRR